MAVTEAREARDAEIIRRREAGERRSAIAAALGVSTGVVSGVLFRAGLTRPTPDRGWAAARTIQVRRVAVADAQLMTQAQAGLKWGVAQTTISRWARA